MRRLALRMHRSVLALALGLAAGLSGAQTAPPAEGGSYRLTRQRMAAGSVDAVAPRYRLGATIGQAEASEAHSARYRLRGGFRVPAASASATELFRDGFEAGPS